MDKLNRFKEAAEQFLKNLDEMETDTPENPVHPAIVELTRVQSNMIISLVEGWQIMEKVLKGIRTGKSDSSAVVPLMVNNANYALDKIAKIKEGM